eukprot:g7585.t1
MNTVPRVSCVRVEVAVEGTGSWALSKVVFEELDEGTGSVKRAEAGAAGVAGKKLAGLQLRRNEWITQVSLLTDGSAQASGMPHARSVSVANADAQRISFALTVTGTNTLADFAPNGTP